MLRAYLDAGAVVCDLQQFQSAVFDLDLEGSGSRINCILNELLQGVDGCDDNFASGDLVDNDGIEGLS